MIQLEEDIKELVECFQETLCWQGYSQIDLKKPFPQVTYKYEGSKFIKANKQWFTECRFRLRIWINWPSSCNTVECAYEQLYESLCKYERYLNTIVFYLGKNVKYDIAPNSRFETKITPQSVTEHKLYLVELSGSILKQGIDCCEDIYLKEDCLNLVTNGKTNGWRVPGQA